MKMKIQSWLCISVVSLLSFAACGAEKAASPAPQPIRYVIGLSPFLDKSVKDDVYRRIVGFLLEDVPLNSSMWIYDAWNVRTITQIDVPDVRAFRSGKTRANQFKEQINKVKEFLAANHDQPQANRLKFDQAVRFPQFMDFVGQNLRASNQSIVVIVLGSPLYADPKEPGFSMADGYFPSDGHLLATREKSVYGLQERAGALKDVMVHFGYFGDPWVSEVYQEKIARFWNLYLGGQGARLATFCGDLPTVFNAAKAGPKFAEARESRPGIDQGQTKLEMLRITRDIGVADWITRDVLPNTQIGPPSKTIGPMKIGIRWKGNIDLDLYAKPYPEAETLFFEHTRSPEGYYFKDHRSSPEREYEFIEFESPVNVWQMEARVNFYEGHAPGGLSGEIRIEFDGKIYSSHFSIVASHGNEGRSGARQRDFWTKINVPEILKLQTDTAQAVEAR